MTRPRPIALPSFAYIHVPWSRSALDAKRNDDLVDPLTGERLRLGSVITHASCDPRDMVMLCAGSVRVTLPSHVAVLNRMREELHTDSELEWVQSGNIRVHDLIGISTYARGWEELVGGLDYSVDARHHVAWVAVEMARIVEVSAPIVTLEVERMIVNGVCVHA